MGVKMNFSRATLISYYGLVSLVLRPVTSCSRTTREREDVALKACLTHWSVTPSTYVIDLQSTLFDANLTHVCRVDKIEEADHCVTTVPVDNCPEVLLFWRHFIDPVNQACGNIKDFTSSVKCVDQTRLKTCQDKTYALDFYSRSKSVRRQQCQIILEYKACMDGVVQDGPDCRGDDVGTLNNVIGLHLLHLGGYYKCSQDYPFVMQPVDSLKGIPKESSEKELDFLD